MPISPAAPSSLRDDLVAMLLVGLWLVAWRALLGASWGFAPVPFADGISPGILHNPGDTWTYLSWVQQYQRGTGLASLLYTTEPHPPLLWVFPLWVVGRIAALTGLPAIGVFNAAGVAGAMFAVLFLRRAAAALRLPPSARNWACVGLMLGSGGSWSWHLLAKLGVAPPAQSAEMFFLDLFPATALVAYAYHALSLALLAALWWQASRLETRRLESRPVFTPAALTVVLAFALVFSRPYEPFAFFGAWTMKTAWHALRRKHDPAAWRASRDVTLLLGLAFTPGFAWTAWIATRPGWSTFASESLSLGLGLGPGSWLFALGGWMILAALGVGPAWRADPRRAVLPLAATSLWFLILVVLGSGQAKLASGLALGPLLLAGWGAARIAAAAGRLPRLARAPAAGAALCALLGVPSLFMGLRAIALQPPARVAPGLWTLAAGLSVPAARPPLVLAGPDVGNLLPGLVGVRVWAGHLSLTLHHREKVARLRAAGLDPGEPPAGEPAAADATLDAILAEAPFDFALLDDRCAAPLARLRALGWISVRTADGWTLLRPPTSPGPP